MIVYSLPFRVSLQAVQAKLVAVRSELAGLNTKAAGLEAKVMPPPGQPTLTSAI